ncbi:MAG: acetyl-CoA carboxylase biotin carboxylase subunit [Bacteroidetes bacterium]|nr:acetyl-CoA carboxylase biotin carboxylase subunit [Bacteroidota bacterium]
MTKITRILIANRGEIAVRIMRTARKMGITTVAIYSEIDRDSLHVKEADEAWCIGEVELSETYLNIPKIIEVAKESGVQAIHPGYGFLAENPLFVDACDEAGIIFIGPGSNAMRIMGNKISAREFVKKSGVPVTEGLTGKLETLLKAKSKIGFPVLLKAAAGGGGKGMRIVHDEAELDEALESTARQALAYFGDDTIYLEKYLDDPRHIEVQILGDNHGNVIHLFERECSIQRRYQKIIEESPSPTLTPELRKKMGEAAVKIGKEIGYSNAGTIEFLVDNQLNFYFLEMNTRVQVEHPVTELVTGVDLVEEQIRVAEGYPLPFKQEELSQNGHAIECRIYAEDPEHNFRPSPGKMTLYAEPSGDFIRIDKGITADTEIKSSFDPMICKLVTWGIDREEATLRMISALQDYHIHGIKTNIPYLSGILRSEAFTSNSISTKFCDAHTRDILAGILKEKEQVPVHLPLLGYLLFTLVNRDEAHVSRRPADPWTSVGFWREEMHLNVKSGEEVYKIGIKAAKDPEFVFTIADESYNIRKLSGDASALRFALKGIPHAIRVSHEDGKKGFISFGGHIFEMNRQDFLTGSMEAERYESSGGHSNEVHSPMPGKVIKIFVEEGKQVKKGELLLIIEAMKMENSIVSPSDAIVTKINVAVNDRVESTKALIILEKIEESENPES